MSAANSVLPEEKKKFPVYLDIEVGGKSKEELLAGLTGGGFYVSNWAKDIMGKPAWKPGKKSRVKFGRATIRELGFTKNPPTREVWARILELGHSLCEPSDGPELRLADKNQPLDDMYWTVMEQIADSDGDPDIFRVSRDVDDKSLLDVSWTGPDDRWFLGRSVVFRLRA